MPQITDSLESDHPIFKLGANRRLIWDFDFLPFTSPAFLPSDFSRLDFLGNLLPLFCAAFLHSSPSPLLVGQLGVRRPEFHCSLSFDQLCFTLWVLCFSSHCPNLQGRAPYTCLFHKIIRKSTGIMPAQRLYKWKSILSGLLTCQTYGKDGKLLKYWILICILCLSN